MSEDYCLDSAAEINVYLDGKSGKDGKSAYEYAVEGGYTGTEDEFRIKLALESLIGKRFAYWSSVPELVSNYDNGIINSGIAQTGYNAPADMAFPVFIISGSISSGTKEFLVIDAKGFCWKGLADLSGGTVTSIIKQTSGGSEYTLPIASPTQLGGVQPVAKDDTMTQAVGVDENGGLFTAPAPESDMPDIPTPAETDNGKYLGVNNGAYALLDAPSGGDSGGGLRLIYSGSTSEVINSIEITTDMEGNPFKLKRIFVVFDNKVTSATNAMGYVYLKDSSTNRYIIVATCDIGVLGAQRTFFMDAETISGGKWKATVGVSNNSANGGMYNITNVNSNGYNVEKITGFLIVGYSTGTWDSTSLTIYGIDADSE